MIIGCVMLAVFFIALFCFVASAIGFLDTVIGFGLSIAGTVFIVVALKFITDAPL